MVAFILGAVIGALISWLSFFVAVYPFYKRQATENAMLRDAVDSWQREAQYTKVNEPWRGGEH